MLNGEVKWFNAEKGYGFVCAGGSDYFVHYKEIRMEGYRSLKEGDKVSFEPAKSPKGQTATDVCLV